MEIPDFRLFTEDPDKVKEEFATLEAVRLGEYYFDCCNTKEKQYNALSTPEAKQAWLEKAMVNAIANIAVVTQLSLLSQWNTETSMEFNERMACILRAVSHTAIHNGEITSMLIRMKFDALKAVQGTKEIEELSKLYGKS